MKLLIVEDEFAIAVNTEIQLKERGYEVIGIASDFTTVMDFIYEETPDLILMDINLGIAETGIDIAKKLKRFIQVPIVFLSAYSDAQTVQNALETEPFGYIVKPYKIEELDIAIQIARRQWLERYDTSAQINDKSNEEFVFIQSGSKVIKTKLEDVLFLQALDNYTILQTTSSRIIISAYLSTVIKKLNLPFLVQTHRSYYVNRSNIESVVGNIVHIKNYEIPISRSNKQEFMEQLKAI